MGATFHTSPRQGGTHLVGVMHSPATRPLVAVEAGPILWGHAISNPRRGGTLLVGAKLSPATRPRNAVGAGPILWGPSSHRPLLREDDALSAEDGRTSTNRIGGLPSSPRYATRRHRDVNDTRTPKFVTDHKKGRLSQMTQHLNMPCHERTPFF